MNLDKFKEIIDVSTHVDVIGDYEVRRYKHNGGYIIIDALGDFVIITEDCIDKVDSPYELVLVAKERATQLNSGLEPTIERDKDKNTVISLREIAEEKIKVGDLVESAVYKLRKHVEQVEDSSEEDEIVGDDFENLYKGEISKSGVPILPSKRARKIPEKLQVSKDDLEELQNTSQQVTPEPTENEPEEETSEVSLDEIKEDETQASEQEDTEATNS